MTFLKILFVMLMVPFVGYLTVKLGTYAFFRGRKIFEEEDSFQPKRRQENDDGEG